MAHSQSTYSQASSVNQSTAINQTSTIQPYSAMDHGLMIVSVSGIAVFLTGFNIFTIVIFLADRKLRKLTSSYPIISFLVGSTIQGMFSAPTYIAKKLVGKENLATFLCDFYRFPYILCEHSMKFSLMIVGIDRLLAIKMPFKYTDSMTKKKMIILLVISWIITISIDVIPFSHGHPESECKYHITRIWGLIVILLYNFLPFCVIIICYGWIWRLAATMTFKDKKLQESLRQANDDIPNDTSNLQSIPLETTPFKETPQQSPSKGSLKQRLSRRASRRAQTVRYAFEMKATKTSLMILAVYVVCWGPLGVFYTIDHFCHNCLSDDDNIHMSRTRMSMKLLCFFSSLIAPLVYCWRMSHFKRRVGSIFCTEVSLAKDKNLLKSTPSSDSY